MNKIYFFGDSFVANTGCRPQDSYYKKTFDGSQRTWTEILSEKYGKEEVNLGSPGLSNFDILNTVWKYIGDINEKDSVVIRIGPYDRYNIDGEKRKFIDNDLLTLDKTARYPLYNYFIKKDSTERYKQKLIQSTTLTKEEIDILISFNKHFNKTGLYQRNFLKNAFKNISLQLREKNIKHFIFDHEWRDFMNDWNGIKKIHNLTPGHFTWEQHIKFAKLISNYL